MKEERIRCQKRKMLFRKIRVGAHIAKLFIRKKMCVKLCRKGQNQIISSVIRIAPYFISSWI
jgi:hypothetical protein